MKKTILIITVLMMVSSMCVHAFFGRRTGTTQTAAGSRFMPGSTQAGSTTRSPYYRMPRQTQEAVAPSTSTAATSATTSASSQGLTSAQTFVSEAGSIPGVSSMLPQGATSGVSQGLSNISTLRGGTVAQ